MDIISVNENKLKVILSTEDLEGFSLRADELDYSRPETRLLLKCLLIRAKSEVGFEAEGNRLLVQLYPSKRGGGEIYITKIGALSDCEYTDGENDCDVFSSELLDYSDGSYDSFYKTTEKESQLDTFIRFEDINAIIGYSKRLISIGYSGPAKAYYTKRHGSFVFFMYISGLPEYPAKLSPSELAAEYGQKITSESNITAISNGLYPPGAK